METKNFTLYKLFKKSIIFITFKTISFVILFVISIKIIDLTRILSYVVSLYILITYYKKLKSFKKVKVQISNFSDVDKRIIEDEITNAKHYFENEYIVTNSFLIHLYEFKIIKYSDILKVYKSFRMYKDEPRYVVNVVTAEGISRFTIKSYYNKEFCIDLDKLILEKIAENK